MTLIDMKNKLTLLEIRIEGLFDSDRVDNLDYILSLFGNADDITVTKIYENGQGCTYSI